MALPDMGGTIRDLEIVDHDHDGDLDLLVVGDFGARLLMNAGAGAIVDASGELLPRGTWEDVTETATLPGGARPGAWPRTSTGTRTWTCSWEAPPASTSWTPSGEDSSSTAARSSSRRWASRVSPRWPTSTGTRGRISSWRRRRPRWSSIRCRAPTPVALTHTLASGAVPTLTDLDLDGAVDVVWSGADGAGQAVYGLALDTAVAAPLPVIEGARGPLMVAEVDAPDPYASPVLDVVTMRGADLVAISPEGDLGSSIYLKFIGKKDNRQGVGAIVEVRAGKVYRRIFLRGGAEVVGIGNQDYADVVRITWPNGVVSQETDVEKGAQFMLDNDTFAEQQEGLIGSCPFLYTWNGETFEFISDVIGITPLGLPMAPGMLVPPDHDEYVLVRGDQLVPDENGELVIQFTEELREVTYLDRVRLDVVDHPASADVYLNERFTFPPFPEPHTHTVSSIAAVKKATGSDGKDWTEELQEQDFRHPAPFARLGGQYLGLAEPHFLELEFDPADLEGAKQLRLVATGWFFWSDASVNVASAATLGVGFVPPMIQIPGPDGTWVPAGPPIGFPAGKTKTMVVDVTDIVPREDPRIRLGSTLELYWDMIHLATCDDDADLVTHPLEPTAAKPVVTGLLEADRPRARGPAPVLRLGPGRAAPALEPAPRPLHPLRRREAAPG